MVRDTGSPRADAESDFLRARRHQVMAAIGARVRGEDLQPVTFSEACEALGVRGEQRLGVLVIPLDRVVGSVDKARDFDRGFRPTSNRARARWERLAQAFRRGEHLPPIDVYRLGDLYFVRDGHHRVSVAKSLGLDLIEADVTRVVTAVSPDGLENRFELNRQHWRRIFLERVPLDSAAASDVSVTAPDDYHRLAEMVEAWSARRMFATGELLDPARGAAAWYRDELKPVVAMIEDAGLRRPDETATDAYLRIAGAKYELTREHTWNAEVLDAVARRKRKR